MGIIEEAHTDAFSTSILFPESAAEQRVQWLAARTDNSCGHRNTWIDEAIAGGIRRRRLRYARQNTSLTQAMNCP
jgi:hypothetical protein